MSGPLGSRAGLRPVAPRQLEILQVIERSLEARGVPPTYREFIIALGLRRHNRQTIHEHLSRLAAKGMLVRHARATRGITLTDAARRELARARAQHQIGTVQ